MEAKIKKLEYDLLAEKTRKITIDKSAVMRKELGGIDMDAEENYLKKLSIEEIKAFNQWGFELYHSIWWKYLVAWMINTQSATALGNILSDDRRALFGAGRVDGLMALRDEVESRKDSYVTDNPDAEEQYDENRIIQG